MTDSKQTYLSLSTGPIYDSMNQARSTRALWSASYLFSYFMKNVINKLRKENYKFLVPYIDNNDLFTDPLKCGLFHDRFIFLQKNQEDFIKLQNVVKDEVKSIANLIATDLDENITTVYEYIQNHFRNCLLQIDIGEDENPIELIDKLLDTQELQPQFNQKEDRSYLKEFFELKGVKKRRNFLIREAFAKEILDDDFNKVRFSSIPEITTAEVSIPLLNRNGGKKDYWSIFGHDQKNPFEALESCIQTKLLRYHKYFAVLQADGDHLGKLIAQLFSASIGPVEERFKGLSEALFNFDIAAIKVIEDYGAMSVYVGGDDILCLAPLKCQGKNIFTLVEDLDKVFHKTVIEAPQLADALSKVAQLPTMTYGISISYYKHPMNEALTEAFTQMRVIAKKKRNSVSFKLLKHSGSHFGACFKKPEKSDEENSKLSDELKEKTLYKNHFLPMLTFKFADSKGNEKTSNFLSSLQYKLNTNHGVLEAILGKEIAIQAFFDNNFNETIHQNSTFIKAVQESVKQAWKETDYISDDSERRKQTIADVHAMLRYVQFINQKANDE